MCLANTPPPPTLGDTPSHNEETQPGLYLHRLTCSFQPSRSRPPPHTLIFDVFDTPTARWETSQSTIPLDILFSVFRTTPSWVSFDSHGRFLSEKPCQRKYTFHRTPPHPKTHRPYDLHCPTQNRALNHLQPSPAKHHHIPRP